MALNFNVRKHTEQLEHSKFVELLNDNRYPATSSVFWDYRDGAPALSSVKVFPKYAVLTYDIGSDQTNGSPFGDNASVDSFSRLRVTQPTTLLDSKSLYDKNSYVFDEIINGTATSVFSAFDSCVDMRTAADGDYVIRQTRVRYNYQPGKGMQYMFTGVFAPENNIVKRIGCFQSLTAAPYEPSDGMWLEVTSAGPVLRVEKSQGTPHSQTVPQSQWNVDRMDGTGPSGLTLNFNTSQLFSIDYEWLGVGRVRFGFYVNGKLYYVHHDNHLENNLVAPYMTFSNQPVRYEIRQTGAGHGLLRHICSSVLIEGSTENVGRTIAIEDGSVTVQNGVYTPVMAAQVHPKYRNASVLLKGVEILNASNPGNSIQYAVFINPKITGGSLTFGDVSNTFLLSAAGNSSLTVTQGVSGYKLLTGYAATGQGNQGTTETGNEFSSNLARLGTRINGEPDTMVLAAKGLGGSANNIHASMNFLEKA